MRFRRFQVELRKMIGPLGPSPTLTQLGLLAVKWRGVCGPSLLPASPPTGLMLKPVCCCLSLYMAEPMLSWGTGKSRAQLVSEFIISTFVANLYQNTFAFNVKSTNSDI